MIVGVALGGQPGGDGQLVVERARRAQLGALARGCRARGCEALRGARAGRVDHDRDPFAHGRGRRLRRGREPGDQTGESG
jgi:hypothetical protein